MLLERRVMPDWSQNWSWILPQWGSSRESKTVFMLLSWTCLPTGCCGSVDGPVLLAHYPAGFPSPWSLLEKHFGWKGTGDLLVIAAPRQKNPSQRNQEVVFSTHRSECLNWEKYWFTLYFVLVPWTKQPPRQVHVDADDSIEQCPHAFPTVTSNFSLFSKHLLCIKPPM